MNANGKPKKQKVAYLTKENCLNIQKYTYHCIHFNFLQKVKHKFIFSFDNAINDLCQIISKNQL